MNFDLFSLAYPIVFRPDVYPDGKACVVAEHPDLPGCVVYGKDEDEARALLGHAKNAYLEYLISKRRNPPMPLPNNALEWRIGPTTKSTASHAPRVPDAPHWSFASERDTPISGVPVHV